MPLTAPIDHVGVLLLGGADARKFLHGQCTQDVLGKPAFSGGAAVVLDARGKNLGDIRFLVREKDIVVFVDRDRAPALRAWLERFIVTADVVIEDVGASWRGVIVTGHGTAPVVFGATGAAPPPDEDAAAHGTFEGSPMLVIGDRNFGAEGCALWASGADAGPRIDAIAADLALRGTLRATADQMEALRIAAFRPRFGTDLDESTLPAESGQESRTVSYTKGCYSGQEVVAKQKYLGKPRKLLVPARPARLTPVPAALAIEQGGRAAGVLTSCALSADGTAIGLAMLKAPWAEGTSTFVTEDGMPVTVDAGDIRSA
jgi:tRNA-modifying protein YgfZ